MLSNFHGLTCGADEKKTLYIVEGEMDALSMYEAGYRNVVSVPSGGISAKSIGKLAGIATSLRF